MINSLGRQLSWALGAQILNTVLGLFTAVILVVWVDPELFGWFAMVGVSAILLTMLRNWGLGKALIHFQVKDEREYRSLHTIMLLLGLASALLLLVGANIIQHFFTTEIPVSIFWAFALSGLFEAFLQVPYGVLTKNGRFPTLGKWEIATKLSSSLTTIGLVYAGYPLEGLLFRAVFPSFSLGLFMANHLRWTVRPLFRFAALNRYVAYSWPFFLDGNLTYAARYVDDALVGRYFGDEALGIYSRAYRLLTLPLATVSLAIGKVYLPRLAEAKVDKKATDYLTATRLVALLLFPLLLYAAITSDLWVTTYLTVEWHPLGNLLSLFAALGIIQCIEVLEAPVFQALGRTKLQLQYAGTIKLITIIGLLLLAPLVSNSWELALGYAILSGFGSIIVTGKVLELLQVSIVDFLRALWPPACAAFICGTLLQLTLPYWSPEPVSLLASFLLFLSSYLFLLFIGFKSTVMALFRDLYPQ